jgi:predicted amidophosphoribosyltransferase
VLLKVVSIQIAALRDMSIFDEFAELKCHLGSDLDLNDNFSRTLKRRTYLDQALSWFRSCAKCGSILPPVNLFCRECLGTLFEQRNTGECLLQSGYDFPVYALFTWTPANDVVVRPFIYAFKNGYFTRLAMELCVAMASEIGERAPLDPWIVFPGKSRLFGRGVQADHAWLLTALLAKIIQVNGQKILGLHLAESLSNRSQKMKSVIERRRRRFKGTEKFSGQDSACIFIDDVITTGATAHAAREALGDHERFEVWTLVCRPKLAGSQSFW